MTDFLSQQPLKSTVDSQCQYFVLRKKRLCRMTVRPGRRYCGEHEPQPKTADGQDDRRIPCPNDPKHTVYVSKLEKHLSICNARATEQPPYIVPNINAPTEVETSQRKPLSQLPRETVMRVIDKVNFLYDRHVKDNITTAPEYPIHSSVMEEFSESDRAESSLRHLRQVSSLLWLSEEAGLVAPNTCYVELGAGKGHVSYYACQAWCGAGAGGALLVDRASLRHKRDNKLRGRTAARLRADLAHLALQRVPLVAACDAVVGLAKHLCGVATDYALRCITAEGVLHKTRGVVLATCCHHRCERAAFFAAQQLQELGISNEEFNVMLGIVSWATCGDGRPRRLHDDQLEEHSAHKPEPSAQGSDERAERVQLPQESRLHDEQVEEHSAQDSVERAERVQLPQESRLHDEQVEEHSAQDSVERAERVQLPQESRLHDEQVEEHSAQDSVERAERVQLPQESRLHDEQVEEHSAQDSVERAERVQLPQESRLHDEQVEEHSAQDSVERAERVQLPQESRLHDEQVEEHSAQGSVERAERVQLSQQQRARAGRRSKRLLDWARVLQLRARGFDARLCYFVPAAVSPENVCILASKRS